MSDNKVPFGKVDDKVLYRWLAIIGVVAVSGSSHDAAQGRRSTSHCPPN